MKDARILLLDDDREVRWQLARVLRAAGAAVTEADDGADGLKLLARSSYDVIVAEVCMPRLGGFGLFSHLRFGDGDSELPHRDTPMVLISREVSRSELARGMDAGLDDFLPKPVDLDEFRARVRAVVRRGRASAAPRTRTHGDLADFGMSALTQALHLGCSSGRLCVRSGAAHGIVDFQLGHISHAAFTTPGYQVQGDEAALLVLGTSEGTFELESVPPSAPRTVFVETQNLLLRAATQADESEIAVAAAAAASQKAAAQEEEAAAFSISDEAPSGGAPDTASIDSILDGPMYEPREAAVAEA